MDVHLSRPNIVHARISGSAGVGPTRQGNRFSSTYTGTALSSTLGLASCLVCSRTQTRPLRRQRSARCYLRAASERPWLPGVPYPSRKDFLKKQINPRLHEDTYELSDSELFWLGQRKQDNQPEFLQSMMGSETFGTRLLSKPRRDILHELEALMEEEAPPGFFSRIDDKQLLDLYNCPPADLPVAIEELQKWLDNDGSPRDLFKEDFLSRDKLMKRRIDSSQHQRLDSFSDDSLRILASLNRSQQTDEILERIGKSHLEESRSDFLRNVVAYCQKNKVESWKVKLAYMDDNFVRFKLGKKNQNQEKWQQYLGLSDGASAVEEERSNDLEDESEEETQRICDPKDARQRLKSWQCAHGDVVGVSACGSLLRDGHIKYLAVCASSDKEEQLVFDLQELAGKGRPSRKALFQKSGPLHVLTEVLESQENLKIVHQSSGLADVLQHVYGVTLSHTLDCAIAWEQVSGRRQCPVELPELFETYNPHLAKEMKNARSADSSPMIRRLQALMEADSSSSKSEPPAKVEPALEAEVAAGLLAIALELTPKLEKGAFKFRANCTEQLDLYRAWPGQHLGAFGLRVKKPFYFDDESMKLCVGKQRSQTGGDSQDARVSERATDDIQKLYDVLPEELRTFLDQRIETLKEDKGDVVEIALDIGREMEVRWRSLEKEGLQIDDVGCKVTKDHFSHILKHVGEEKFN
ncbi:unnamed protein product [Durusdinium trenchii]|uniref:Uncharacterized protein n=1 Tax=Durusdinium trenchii TaxID=1381693 RepID=A0ABP0HZL4_9DINO